MDPPRDPFGVAVAAIRDRIRSGRFVQGEQLMARELAQDLRLSATPVREALARLAGEGVIEDRRGAGYFAWRMDAVDLTELYDLQAGCLRMALARRAGTLNLAAEDLVPAVGLTDPVAEMEAQLVRVIQCGRSLALLRVHGLLADRLAPTRRVEPKVLAGAPQEWAALAEALRPGGDEPLEAWIEAYAARRRAAAADLVAAMRSAADRLRV